MENMENDPYWDFIQERWESIQKAYNMFAHLRPVLVYELDEDKIYSYPYHEFKESLLSEHSRMGLTLQYEAAQESNQIVLFIRDETNQKLRSYIIDHDPTIKLEPERISYVRYNKKKAAKKKRQKKAWKKRRKR